MAGKPDEDVDKGFDWLILNSLDGKEIDKIEISTHHFKGNFPSPLFFTSRLFAQFKKFKTNCKIIKHMEVFA